MNNEENPVRMQVVYLIYIIIAILYLSFILGLFPFICNRLRNKNQENKGAREIIRRIK